MRRLLTPDPYRDAKLLGILLAGVFGQTRTDYAPESRLRLDLRPSGVQRISRPELKGKPKA